MLALNPGIIIFDEALAMLDEKASERIVAVMQKLKDEGKTLVLIDHTLKGLQLCHKIFLMEEGRIIRRGPRESILADQAYLRRHKMMIGTGVAMGLSLEQVCYTYSGRKSPRLKT